jgi:hypothetical protein
MTVEAAAVEELPPTSGRMGLLLWGGVLTLLVTLAIPAAGIINLPVIFFLKNRLHLTASGVATFNLLASIPLYASFVFGFLRDRWSPFGAGDRGHLVVFGLVAGAMFIAIAYFKPTYGVLLAGLICVTTAILMVASAVSGVVSAIGQHNAVTGRASAVMNVALLLPALIAWFLGGTLSGMLEGQNAVNAARILFLGSAAMMALIAFLGWVGPRQFFAAARLERPTRHFFHDIGRLLSFWPVYPALIIQVLWQFGPAAGTVLQFHLANALHATDAQVGLWYAIFSGAFLPTFLLYGWLAQRVRLSWLLWLGAILAVPQMVPLLFIHSVTGALIAAAAMGMLGGIGQAAFIDLAIRSCPPGLRGTMMMLISITAYWIPVRLGDLWGTDLYQHHGGFQTAVFATIGVYAMILPVLLLIPRRLTSTMDGQAIEEKNDAIEVFE